METEIDLREYLKIIRQRFWVVVLVTVMAVAISGVLSTFVVTPTYEASTSLVVRQEYTELDEYNALMLNRQMVSTYSELVKSRRVSEQVIDRLELDMNYEQLTKSVSVVQVKNTEMFKIIVQDRDKERAEDIAKAYTEVFSEVLKGMGIAVDVVVVDQAKALESPVKPNRVLNLAIALVFGLMIGIFLVFLLAYFDTSMKNEKDVQRYLDLPVLADVPNMDD